MTPRALLGFALSLSALTAAVGAQTQVLYSETFTGPNRSAPSGWESFHTPEGNFWYLRSGALTSGNGDNVIAQDKRTYIVAAAGLGQAWRDYEVVADAYMNQRIGGLMLLGRWQDEDNHYQGVYETQGGRVVCRIVRRVGGVNQVLAEVSSAQNPALPNMANGQTMADGRRFRLVFQGDQITFHVDRREILRTDDSAIAAGSAGLGQFENFVFFDNFRVVGQAGGAAVTTAQPTETQVERVFRLQVAEDYTRQQARDYQRWLENTGFLPVIVDQQPDGFYGVLTGTFLSEDEARRRGDFLLGEGELLSYSVREIRGVTRSIQELEAAQEAQLAHTVQVHTTSDRAEATQIQRTLTQGGYFPVVVIREGDEHIVYVGNFSEMAEAERLLPSLAGEGYTSASVARVAREELVESAAVLDTQTGQEILAQLPTDERGRVQDILERQQLLAGGANTVEEIQELRELMRQIREETSGLRESVMSIQEEAQREEAQRREIGQLIEEAESAVDRSDWAAAERALEGVFAIDPNEIAARRIQRRVTAARSAGRPTGTVAGAVDRALASAAQHESRGDLTMALVELTGAQRSFPADQRLREEITRIRQQVNAQQAQAAPPPPARSSGMGDQMLYVLIGGGAALLFVVLIFVYLLRRQERTLRQSIESRGGAAPAAGTVGEPEAAFEEEGLMPDALGGGGAQEPEAAPALAGVGSGGIGIDPHQADQDVSALSAVVLGTMSGGAGLAQTEPEPTADVAPVALEPEPPMPKPATQSGGESERVSLDFGGEDIPEAPIEEPPPEPESVPMGDIEEPPLAPMEPAPEPELAPEPSSLDLGLGDAPVVESEPAPVGAPIPTADDPFADLMDDGPPAPAEEKTEHLAPGADETQPMSLSSEDVTETIGLGEPPIGDFDIFDDPTSPQASETKTLDPAPAAPQADDGSIFALDFKAAQAGSQPEDWKGSYDFANLQVVTEGSPPNGAEACLRFEKSSGAGSAFYACHFPDASGRVGIEFDLRCDHKNQYLLGLYFEHDENFRQSVHTVMHRAGDTVTLRLQGKSAPYEFGNWVHIKFRIDLNTGTVDGQVDGVPVAVNVPLLSMTEQTLPPSINTISIRDTLASEGVFMVANIRVYSA